MCYRRCRAGGNLDLTIEIPSSAQSFEKSRRGFNALIYTDPKPSLDAYEKYYKNKYSISAFHSTESIAKKARKLILENRITHKFYILSL